MGEVSRKFAEIATREFFWNMTLFKVVRKSENRAKNGRMRLMNYLANFANSLETPPHT